MSQLTLNSMLSATFGLMLVHRLRRWPNIKPTVGQHLVESMLVWLLRSLHPRIYLPLLAFLINLLMYMCLC